LSLWVIKEKTIGKPLEMGKELKNNIMIYLGDK
jgi:hypothetical protein